MSEGSVSQREFDMLAAQVGRNASRVEAIDQGGTRGVGALQLQVTELIRDVSTLTERMNGHDAKHEADAVERIRERERERQERERRRVSARRFAITTAIAASTAIGGLYALLAEIAGRLH